MLTADDSAGDDNDHAAAYTVSARGGDAMRIATTALAGSVYSYFGHYFSGPWWAPDGRLVVARALPAIAASALGASRPLAGSTASPG